MRGDRAALNFLQDQLAEWQGLGLLFVAGARILVIWIGAWLLIALGQRGIRVLRLRIASCLDDCEAVMCAKTLGRVFRQPAAVVVSVLATLPISTA